MRATRPGDASSFVEGRKTRRLQSGVGPESAVVADYGASATSRAILIGRDGRAIAEKLRGKRIEEATAEALKAWGDARSVG